MRAYLLHKTVLSTFRSPITRTFERPHSVGRHTHKDHSRCLAFNEECTQRTFLSFLSKVSSPMMHIRNSEPVNQTVEAQKNFTLFRSKTSHAILTQILSVFELVANIIELFILLRATFSSTFIRYNGRHCTESER